MKTLLASTSDIDLVRFFNANATKLRLLCDPDFVADMFYARRDDKDAQPLNVPIEALSTEALEGLRKQAADPGEAPLYVVASPADEAERLRNLRNDYPTLAFVGLAEHVVAALVAQAGHKVFEPLDGDGAAPPCKLAVLFATPRSGSSYVCDVMEGLGIGRPKEHLRDTLIELFASSYRFDKVAAIRNFLRFSAIDGWVGTKLIVHFADDFVQTCGLATVGAALDADIQIHPLFLDRQDRALQAVSGELAARRGVWHITDAASREKIQTLPAVGYDFYSILKRYIGYTSQGALLDSLRGLFGHRLDLTYEKDVVDHDRLVGRLSEFLGVSATGAQFTKAARRERIADEVNDQFKLRFLDDFESKFGRRPMAA